MIGMVIRSRGAPAAKISTKLTVKVAIPARRPGILSVTRLTITPRYVSRTDRSAF